MAIQDVRIRFQTDTGDLEKARKALDDISKEEKEVADGMKRISAEGKKAASDVDSGFGKIGNTIKGVGATLAAVGAFEALSAGISKITEVTAKFQKFEAVLTNTLGSKSAAKRALNDITEFAAKTPFAVDEITDSYIKLANRGLKPTTTQLRQLGDLAASQGKSLDQLTEATLDAITGENERLKEFGIQAKKVGDQTQFTFKGVTTTVANSDKAIQEYILSLGDAEGVTGSMAAISGTLDGQMNNLGDSVDDLALAFGETLAPAIGGVISVLSELTKGAANAIRGTAAVISSEELGFFKKVSLFVQSAFGDVNAIAEIATTYAVQKVKSLGEEIEETQEKQEKAAAKTEAQLKAEKKALDELLKAREAYRKLVEDLGRGEDLNGLRKLYDEYFDLQERIVEQGKKANLDNSVIARDLAKADFDFQQKLMLDGLNTQIDVANKVKEKEATQAKEKLDRQKALDKALVDQRKQAEENIEAIAEEAFRKDKERQEKLNEIRSAATDFALSLADFAFDASAQRRDRELEDIQSKQQAELQKVGDNEQAKDFIRKKYAEEERRVKQRQAQADKNQAIFQILVSTAMAVAKANPVIPLMAFAAATGALQLALVASRPIPKFARGTEHLNGKPGTDTNLIWADTGERIIDKHTNRKLKGIKNRELPRLVELGKLALNQTYNNDPAIVKELQMLRGDFRNQPKEITNIDEYGISRFSYTQNMRKQKLNKRFSW